MSSMTQAEVQETREYWAILNQEQKEWVIHKCRWEQIPRPFVLDQYRSHIDSLAAPQQPKE